MRSIKGLEWVESAMGRWNPSDLVRIVDFHYAFDPIGSTWNVTLEADSDRDLAFAGRQGIYPQDIL